MFYCDECATTRSWPETMSRSRGTCETCGRAAVCNDSPAGSLPAWPAWSLPAWPGEDVREQVAAAVNRPIGPDGKPFSTQHSVEWHRRNNEALARRKAQR